MASAFNSSLRKFVHLLDSSISQKSGLSLLTTYVCPFVLPLVNQGEACCCHATALRYQSATMAAAATLFPVRSTNKSSNRWKDGCFLIISWAENVLQG